MSEQNESIKIIKPEAIIAITMSTGFYQKIQGVVAYIIKDKSRAEIEEAHELIKSDKVVPGSWVDQYLQLSILCAEIERSAIANDQVTEIPLKDL